MYRAIELAALLLGLVILLPPGKRCLTNPDRLLAQHRLLPGTSVLLAGPLPFSLRAARLVGRLTCLDAEPQRLKAIKEAAVAHNIPNVVTVAGDIAALPFDANRFDQVVLIGALGQTGDPEGALAEIARVLKDSGRFTVSDSILERGYQAPRNVVRLSTRVGFTVNRAQHNILSYTLEMVKPLQVPKGVDRKVPQSDILPEQVHG